MKTFYLMRHGQTRFNEQHRIQGVCDAPLTELGIQQAQTAGAYLKAQGIIPDELYCSTSERASDTLELVTGRTDYTRLKGLKEWDFGAFEGQPEYLNPKLQPNGLGYGDYFAQFGGETNEQVRDRMEATVRQILENSAEGSTLLAVSHGGAMAQFFRRVLTPAPDVRGMKNCCILHFTYEDGIFDLLSIYNPVEETYVYQR
ncbi:histidine phosphatase family protein [Streptococcus dentiloxodontae]